MNIERLREQLEIDEGVKYEIYKDHLGYPTFGIGHLILDSDAEHGQDTGTAVSEERVAKKPLKPISFQSCLTANLSTETLEICQKMLRK